MVPPFSRRIDWRRAENALARAEHARRQAGAEVLDLTETNPTAVDFLSADHAAAVAEALGRAARAGYTPTPRGLPEARRAVAAEYAQAGTPIDPDRIILTASSSESYAYLWKLLCDPGDVVLTPEPSYPLFEYLARLEGINTRPYRLDHDGTRNGDWELALASVDDALAAARESARALVIVSPNNPTGSILREDEIAALDARAATHGLAIVADEVFAAYREPTPPAAEERRAPAVRCLATRQTQALTFSLGGLSKSCGLPHLKLGWIVVGGPAALADAALAGLDLVADTYLSVATPVQRALPELLRTGASIRVAIAARVAANRRHLRDIIGRDSALTLLRADGGWSSIVRVPATKTDEAWALELLERDGVLCHPGYFFDLRGGAFLVLSLLPVPAVFAQAVERLVRRVAESIS